MRLFLDTANIDEIKEAFSWGIIDGVTTNPSLIKKAVNSIKSTGEDIDMESYIKKILATVGRRCPVSLEVGGISADEMIEQGISLFEKFDSVAGNVVIKIPVCTVDSKGEGNFFDGIIAINKLSEEKIPINATLIFTPEQALLAAKAGAEYLSPFAGRIDDRIRKSECISFGKSDYFPSCGIFDSNKNAYLNDFGLVSGVDLVSKTSQLIKIFGFECNIIASSLRNSQQVRECALAGADIATLPFDTLKSLIIHPGTQDGIDSFTGDLVPEYTAILKPSDKNLS